MASGSDLLDLRPFDARSLALSILLGLDPPALPARALVALGDRFGIADGTMRVALSRMVGRGELVADGGTYRLTGRLLDRKAAQDVGRRPAPTRWDGAWWVAVVTVPRRSVAERRAFRTSMANARMGELRPDTWMRPANLPGPGPVDGLATVRGELAGDDPGRLAATLWSLGSIAADADQLRRRLDAAQPALDVGDADALPASIGISAVVVRFLRAEPLLPPALVPSPWPPDDLRTRYAEFDRAVGRLLRRATG